MSPRCKSNRSVLLAMASPVKKAVLKHFNGRQRKNCVRQEKLTEQPGIPAVLGHDILKQWLRATLASVKAILAWQPAPSTEWLHGLGGKFCVN